VISPFNVLKFFIKIKEAIMTIGISILLKNTAILVADGRKTDHSNQKSTQEFNVLSDNANKIEKIDSEVGLIHFGIEKVTNKVVKKIKEKNICLSPDQIANLMNLSLECEWNTFIEEEKMRLDKDNEVNKAGLVIAGFSKNKSFMCGKLIGFFVNDQIIEMVTEEKPVKFFILGGRDIAKQIFSIKLSNALKGLSVNSEGEDRLEIIDLILGCAGELIREEEKYCNQIGGRITFSTLSVNGNYRQDILSI
jgi:hypothetical protein